jgi:hypothetical protein
MKNSWIKHGLTFLKNGERRPEWRVWRGMRERCGSRSKKSDFKYYRGRGIKICKRWNNFKLFFMDMGKRPGKNYSIERINNNKGYTPKNCRWASHREQANNRRNTRKVTFNGQTLPLSNWARKLKIKYVTLWSRIFREGWSVEKTLTTPRLHGFSKLTEKNVRFIRREYSAGRSTRRELAEQFNMSKTGIKSVIKRVTWAHV